MLKKERFNLLCQEYQKISSVNPLERTRRHTHVVARQVISLILKKKIRLSEYSIAILINQDRSNVYHNIETAKTEIDRGRIEYIESLEYWKQALSSVPLEGAIDFAFSLKKIIDSRIEENKMTNQEAIQILREELNYRLK